MVQRGPEADSFLHLYRTTCRKEGKCVFGGIVNDVAEKFKECDGIIVASPVYYASPNGTLVSFLDRLFYSTTFDKRMKVGAAMVVARRGGTTAAVDQLNKYFTISGMPVASSQYWNSVHGGAAGLCRLLQRGVRRVALGGMCRLRLRLLLPY